MIKMNKSVKRILAVIGCLLVIPFAVGSCVTSVTAHAEETTTTTGREVLDDTRYSSIGFGTVFDIISFVESVLDGQMDIGMVDSRNKLIDKFASQVANDAYYNTFDLNKYAIESTQGYQIKDIYAMMAKRKIVYPINGYEETQYLYVYQNKNVGATAQQFGNYTIAPNTLFMVRQTNFLGVLAYSIPLAENSINLSFGNSSKPLGIVLPANQNFKMYTETGTESFVLPHGVTVFVENNSVNSIVNDHLQAVYDYDISHNSNYYDDYLPDGYMDGLEALMGVGISYIYSDWTTDWTGYGGDGTDQNPWYVTGFFSNTDVGTGLPSYYSTNININPALPPAYIMSPDNPLYSGKVINNENINNYNDYGVTMVDGTLEIDPDILAGALAGLIDPDFAGALGGVFNAQPQIGLGFDTPLDLNLPDLVDDYIQSIIVYPPSGRPDVPIITTLSEWDMLPSYTTETFPVAVQDGYSTLTTHTTDFTDAIGVTSVFLILALIGLMIYAIF